MTDPLELVGQLRAQRITDAANEAGIRPELVHAVVSQESGGRNDAVSPKGATGLMQVMPATAAKPGYGVQPFDPKDPDQNLKGGTAYLKALIDHFGGDEQKALAAYNAGPGTVEKGGPLPTETQKYVPSVEAKAGGATSDDDPLAFVAARRAALQAPPPAAAPAPSAEPAGPESSAGERFVNGVWQNLDPIAAVKGIATAVAHPLDAAAGIVNAGVDQFQKAKNAYNQGRYSEALGHGAAAALPLIGPAAANAGDKIASGDIAGGLGEGVGQIGAMLIPHAVKSIVGSAAEGTANKLVNSNLKPSKALKKANPTVPPAQAFLKQGVNMTKGGLETLTNRVEDQGNQLSDLVQGKPGTFSLRPVLQKLSNLEAEYLHQPNADADLAAVRSARESLLNNPLYSKDVTAPTMVQQHTPASTILNGQGQPMTPASSTMVPGPNQVVGRELVPQSAAEIDRMKKNVYQGLKGKYGKEGSGVIESDKATGRALKGILDDNVPGAKEINSAQKQTIVAKNALQDAITRQENNHAFGLLDMMQLGLAEGGVSAGMFGHPIAGAVGAGVGALMYGARHPLPASYMARGAYGVSKLANSKLANAAASAVAPGVQVENNKRPVTQQEAQERYKVYLASQTEK